MAIVARGEFSEAQRLLASFQFLEARTVLADLGIEAADPTQVVEVWPRLDDGAVFLHLVEAPVFGRTEYALIPWLRARSSSAWPTPPTAT